MVGDGWGLVVWGSFVCQDEDSGVAAYAGYNSLFESPMQNQVMENAAESTRSGFSSSSGLKWLPSPPSLYFEIIVRTVLHQ